VSKVDAAPVFLWSAVEVSIGIFVAGILELRPLLGKYNVKGFENYSPQPFSRMNDESDMMRLKDMTRMTSTTIIVAQENNKPGFV
jgi:hypothetical protein